MLEVGTLITGVITGPIIGLFMVGMLLPWVNNTGALTSFIGSILLTRWEKQKEISSEIKNILKLCFFPAGLLLVGGFTKLLLPIQVSQCPLLPGLDLVFPWFVIFNASWVFIVRFKAFMLSFRSLNKSKEHQLGICLVSDLTSLDKWLCVALAQTCSPQPTPIQQIETLAQSLINMFSSSTSGFSQLTPFNTNKSLLKV